MQAVTRERVTARSAIHLGVTSAIMACLVGFACAHAPSAAPVLHRQNCVPSVQGPPDRGDTTFLGARAAWVAAARRVPGGYGGWRQASDRWVLRLVDTSAARAAKAAIIQERAVLDANGTIDTAAMRAAPVEKVRWSVPQLYDWLGHIRGPLISASRTQTLNLVSLGVLEVDNQLSIEVASRTDQVRLEGVLADMAVPCNLVLLRVGPPYHTQQ